MVLALKDTADFPIPTKNIVDNDANFNYSTVDSINAYDRTYLSIINANRSFFFPPANVLIERSTDGGSTWTTVSTSDYSTENRGKMFSDVGASGLTIGTGNAALTQQLRVTMQSPGSGWYCSLDRAYLRWSNSGHTTSVTIQASTYGAQSTYTNLVNETVISGWSGNDMYKFTRRTAWGTNNSNHLYNIRFIFKYTAINANYPTNQANLIKINMYGADFWGTSGTPRYAGHLYNWDYLQNVTFPAILTATTLKTGTAAADHLLTRKIRGDNNGTTYYHAIDMGYTNHDRCDFYEYGGVWNFWRNQSSTATTDTNNLALGITLDNVKNKSYTYTWPNKSGTFALTSDIPTVNNATLTIQKNGTTVDTFTANASSNVTANITVPTSFSDLTGTVSDSQLDWSSILDKIYPVGSVYISVNNVSPQTFIGGTWVAFATGRTLVGVDTGQTEFDTVEETGGEATHTLIEAELPNINGHLPHVYGGEKKISGVFSIAYGSTSSSTGNNANANNAYYNMNFGQGQAHNNLQPYITVYMWKRTA